MEIPPEPPTEPSKNPGLEDMAGLDLSWGLGLRLKHRTDSKSCFFRFKMYKFMWKIEIYVENRNKVPT